MPVLKILTTKLSKNPSGPRTPQIAVSGSSALKSRPSVFFTSTISLGLPVVKSAEKVIVPSWSRLSDRAVVPYSGTPRKAGPLLAIAPSA